MACSSIRTLNIAITDPPTIPPANGYTVKWRPVGTTTWNTVSNLYGNTFTIPNIPGCFNLEGTIQSTCADGSLSSPTTFAVVGSSSSCITYSLLSVGIYTYVQCGTTEPTVVEVTTAPLSICAVAGTVASGTNLAFSTTNATCQSLLS